MGNRLIEIGQDLSIEREPISRSSLHDIFAYRLTLPVSSHKFPDTEKLKVSHLLSTHNI